MAIVQINVFTCEDCGVIETTSEVTHLWSDPCVVSPEDAWDHRLYDDKLCCPVCLVK